MAKPKPPEGMPVLRAYLEEHRLTQVEFAEQIGVSQPTVCDVINGKSMPSTRLLLAISKKTGLSLDKLFSARTVG